jgi:surface antigen
MGDYPPKETSMTDQAFTGRRGAPDNRCQQVFLIAALLVSAMAGAVPAHAQINPFRSYSGPTLTKDDLSAGSAAFRTLLEKDPASIGEAETWIDPKTGNQGKFTLRRIFERSGMPCRDVASEVIYKQTKTKREFTLTACRVAGGDWKLSH